MLTVSLTYRTYVDLFFGAIFVEIFSLSFTIAYERDGDWELSLSICLAYIEMLA